LRDKIIQPEEGYSAIEQPEVWKPELSGAALHLH
jgi:hypothetical protein